MPGDHEAFLAGELLRIADEATLREFQQRWTYHHPLVDVQITYAKRICFVRHIGYYHGNGCLYELGVWGPDVPATLQVPYPQSQDEAVPGFWHEACLRDYIQPKEEEPPLACDVYTVIAETRQGQPVVVVKTHTGIECLVARFLENERQAAAMNAVASIRNAEAFERRYAFQGVSMDARRTRYSKP